MTQSEDRPQPGRHDMYRAIHRGLRLGHARLLPRVGATDFTDPAASAALAADLRGFLALAHSHLLSEETLIHPEIEAREPGATEEAHDGHDDHERAFDELAALLDAIAGAEPAQRPALGDALYHRYAHFVAADLVHMEDEETRLLGTMHRLFRDDELRAIEGRIVAGADPDKMTGYLSLIVPALDPAGAAELLSGVRAALPPAAFDGLWHGTLAPALSPATRDAIQRRLARPAAA